MRADTVASSAKTEAIFPRGAVCINCPRLTINARPASKLNTPAIQAATYSPTLWPISKLGLIPQDCHNMASEYSRANIAG